MPSWIHDFFGPLLIGVFITMVIEAASGRALGLLVRQRFERRARRRLKALGGHADLIWRGPECLYTIEFVPDGWRPEDLQVQWRTSRDLEARLQAADPRHLPRPAAEILERIAAERERLASDEDGWWNGASLAVEVIRASRSPSEERPVLRLVLAPTDFAAAQVCTELWLEAFDGGTVEVPVDLGIPIPGMVNAVGLNATLVTDDGQLVLVRRSARMTSGRAGLHISVNEGMRECDRNLQRSLDPHVGIVRGVREELGIDIQAAHVRLHTAMFDVRRYQFGLLGHIDLTGSGISAADIMLARRHGFAQDKFENTDLLLVPWEFDAVVEVLSRPEWVAHGWLNLLHSAVSSFSARSSDIYRLVGVDPPRPGRIHAR